MKPTPNPEARQKPIKIIVPADPPELTPAAARVLLKIIVDAVRKQEAAQTA